ncbi:MAG: hypothetical protein ACOZBW_04225 [Thermodesulfobacteriota bacterium]
MKLNFFFKKRSVTGGIADDAAGLPPTPETSVREPDNFFQTGGDLLPPVIPPGSLERLRAGIPETAASMKSFVEGSEGDFMLLGISLRMIHTNVTELTELMLGTVKQMGTIEKGGFLDRGRRILNESLAEIAGRQTEVRANLERINRVMQNLEKLYATSKQIKKFSQSLKTVALNMLVENARTIDRSVNIFSDVAQEIKDLSVNISGIANDVHKNVENACSVYRITLQEIAAGIARLETLTTQIRTTVQESTHNTEDLMRFAVDTIEQAGRRSREISRQVAEIVVGVQFHDNMRQRVLYVCNRLKAVLAVAEKKTAVNGSPATTKPAAVIMGNQAGRLFDINAEISEVYDKNRSALERIGREVDDLIASIGGTDAGPEGEAASVFRRDPFSHLKGALTQLHDLLHRGDAFYRQIREAAAQVSSIAVTLSELLALVKSISANTHNKAINSIIAADRLGEKGGALKLLAKEMNALATQSDGFSAEVEDIITFIMDSAGEISRTDAQSPVQPAAEGSAVSRLNRVIHDVSMGYESFRQDSLAAYDRARDLKKAVETTLASLDFFQGLSRNLATYADRLGDMARLPGLDAILVEADVDGASRLPGRHTADNGNKVILFEDVRKETPGGSDDDTVVHDLGTNVELF